MPIDTNSLNQAGSGPSAAPDIGGDSYEFGVQEDRDQLKEAHRRNIALGVLAAGLATMGAQPRGWRRRATLGEALGEGGLAGLNVYGGAENQLANQRMKQQQMQLERVKLIAQLKQTQALRNIQQQNANTMELMRRGEIKRWDAQDRIAKQNADSLKQFRGAEEGHWKTEEGIQAENAGSLAGIRGTEESLKNLEAQQLEPGGVDTLQGLRKAKNLPEGTPSAEEIKRMPAKDALAWQREVYTTLAKGGTKNANIHYEKLEDGVHKIVSNPATGETISDTFIGKAPPTKGGNANREELRRLTGLPSETGETPAAAAATPGATLTPAAAPGAPPSRPLPTVGYKTKLADGQYHMAGKIYTVKGGKVAKIDDAPSVPTAE